MSAEPSDMAITELGLPTYTQLRNRVAEIEAALRPFADTYRFVQQVGAMREDFYASMTIGKFTVQDLARAAELIPQQTKP